MTKVEFVGSKISKRVYGLRPPELITPFCIGWLGLQVEGNYTFTENEINFNFKTHAWCDTTGNEGTVGNAYRLFCEYRVYELDNNNVKHYIKGSETQWVQETPSSILYFTNGLSGLDEVGTEVVYSGYSPQYSFSVSKTDNPIFVEFVGGFYGDDTEDNYGIRVVGCRDSAGKMVGYRTDIYTLSPKQQEQPDQPGDNPDGTLTAEYNLEEKYILVEWDVNKTGFKLYERTFGTRGTNGEWVEIQLTQNDLENKLYKDFIIYPDQKSTYKLVYTDSNKEIISNDVYTKPNTPNVVMYTKGEKIYAIISNASTYGNELQYFNNNKSIEPNKLVEVTEGNIYQTKIYGSNVYASNPYEVNEESLKSANKIYALWMNTQL